MEDIRTLYREWQIARDQRRGRGSQRPSNEEITALDRLIEARSTIDDSTLNELLAGMQASGDPGICSCGHHTSVHHGSGGSCFHIVGCATVCPCEGTSPGAPPESES